MGICLPAWRLTCTPWLCRTRRLTDSGSDRIRRTGEWLALALKYFG